LGNAAEASNILQKIIAAIPNHLPTRIKLIEAHIGLAHEKREEGSKAGYQIILENALRVAVDGFNYPTKSVWLFRFVGRILTLFLKDNMECNADLLVKLLDALKKFAQDSDSKFLDDYHSSFTSFPLFKCCVISLIVSCRQAHEFADLQALCLYDLALCTYYGYMRQEENILILRKAIQIIRICIDILPDSDLFWNAAGVFLQSVDLARSQHCFIKATYLSNSVRLAY
jgi:tetratricopeptide (TPR) repeat protein